MILLIFLSFLTSCKKGDSPAEEVIPDNSAIIKINTFFKNRETELNKPLPNVAINIFLEKNDLILNEAPLFSGTTDSTGYLNFDGLNEPTYWVRATSKEFGEQEKEVKTPPKTIKFVEFVF